MTETKMIEVSEIQLKELLELNQKQLNEIAQKDLEIKALYNASINIMELLGVAAEGKIKPEMMEDGNNPLPEIMKEAGSLVSLVMKSQIPLIGKKAEAQLVEKFSFFGALLPLFQKYEKQYGKK